MLPSRVRIFVATKHADFRCGIDGLLAVVRDGFGDDAFQGDLFVFFNRRRDRVRLLQWDRNGFWLHHKRLERGVFESMTASAGTRVEIDRARMSMLLEGIDSKSSRFRRGFSRDVRIQPRDHEREHESAAR